MTNTGTLTPAAEFPRRFLAPDAEFGEWSGAEPYFCKLCERPLNSREDLERWLLDWSELNAAFFEEGTSRSVAYTQQTDDPVRQERKLYFLEHVAPHAEPWQEKLRRKFVAAATHAELPARRYEVLDRSIRNAIEIFREENIPLITADAKLRMKYQEIVGRMTCTFRGAERTLEELALFQEEPDRAVREETWRLAADRYLRDASELDRLYEEMVQLRQRIARNAGLDDYRAYVFRDYERFDYTPHDCLEFHDAIERVVVPAAAELAALRRRKLGLGALRPWDTQVDVENRPPLRPFQTAEELADGCSRIFHKVNPELGRVFDGLRQRELLDLATRKGKAPGGYQEVFRERRLPFIFMNAAGSENDVSTLLHEGGHAFHSWACRQEPLLPYRSAPIEFAEVASMGMECLAAPFLEEFYGDHADRARQRHFEDVIKIIPWIARVDAFQHYVYTHVDSGVQPRHDEWVRLGERFQPYVDWLGLESYHRTSWQRKLHFFEVPFYYIEYAIAQLGALQVWLNSRRDYEQAVALYRNGLALGASRPLPELFEAAGLKFDFSERTLRPLVDAVMEEIARLR